MKTLPTGYLTLALRCGELVWAFTGISLVPVLGIGSVVAAMLWEN
jgi:hypothetical protein